MFDDVNILLLDSYSYHPYEPQVAAIESFIL